MPETWTTYRQQLAGALGFHLLTQQSSTGASAAANQVVCPDLIDSNLEPQFLDNSWEFQTSGGNAYEVRRVANAGLAPGTGTVSLSRAHSTTTSSAANVEFYGVLPPMRHLGRRGILQAANLALKECWFIDTLAITGISTAYQYGLATSFPWLAREDQVVDVYVRRSGDNRDSLVSEWRFINDLDGPQLEFKAPFSSADTIKPVVYRPLDTWIKQSSTWADSTSGLSTESDQGLLSVHGMLAVGLFHCYDFLATEGSPEQRSSWKARADTQRKQANVWKLNTLPHQQGRDVHWTNTRSAWAAEWPLEGSLSS